MHGRLHRGASLHSTLLPYERLGDGSIDKLKPAPLSTVRDRSLRQSLPVLLDIPSAYDGSLVTENRLVFGAL